MSQGNHYETSYLAKRFEKLRSGETLNECINIEADLRELSKCERVSVHTTDYPQMLKRGAAGTAKAITLDPVVLSVLEAIEVGDSVYLQKLVDHFRPLVGRHLSGPDAKYIDAIANIFKGCHAYNSGSQGLADAAIDQLKGRIVHINQRLTAIREKTSGMQGDSPLMTIQRLSQQDEVFKNYQAVHAEFGNAAETYKATFHLAEMVEQLAESRHEAHEFKDYASLNILGAFTDYQTLHHDLSSYMPHQMLQASAELVKEAVHGKTAKDAKDLHLDPRAYRTYEDMRGIACYEYASSSRENYQNRFAANLHGVLSHIVSGYYAQAQQLDKIRAPYSNANRSWNDRSKNQPGDATIGSPAESAHASLKALGALFENADLLPEVKTYVATMPNTNEQTRLRDALNAAGVGKEAAQAMV